jgi:hypothetical protein
MPKIAKGEVRGDVAEVGDIKPRPLISEVVITKRLGCSRREENDNDHGCGQR